MSEVWEPRQDVTCILRTLNPPPPNCMPRSACSASWCMGVGEVTEGHGITYDCAPTNLLHISLCRHVARERGSYAVGAGSELPFGFGMSHKVGCRFTALVGVWGLGWGLGHI